MPLLWAGRKGPASYTRYFALGMHLSPALQSPFSFHLGCGYDARKKKRGGGGGGGGVVSAPNLSHCRLLICCNLVSLLAVVSAASVHADRFLSLPFGSLSTAPAPISLLRFLNPAFARLSRGHRSFPPSYRQAGSAVKQDLYRLLHSTCLHNW